MERKADIVEDWAKELQERIKEEWIPEALEIVKAYLDDGHVEHIVGRALWDHKVQIINSAMADLGEVVEAIKPEYEAQKKKERSVEEERLQRDREQRTSQVEAGWSEEEITEAIELLRQAQSVYIFKDAVWDHRMLSHAVESEVERWREEREEEQEELRQRDREQRTSGKEHPTIDCVCVHCGERLPKPMGIPCRKVECPRCGLIMRGSETTREREEQLKKDREWRTSKLDFNWS